MTDFPAAGQKYKADFGDFAFQLDFTADGKGLTYTAIGEKGAVTENDTAQETVSITTVPVREGVFLVFWQEASKTTVTHLEDFERGLVYSNITTADGGFLNLRGSLSLLD